jgi:hypothetical protein
MWKAVARGNWRSFKEARAFVLSLGLKSQAEWYAYVKSGQKPNDIPSNPHLVYKGVGWICISHWLGTGRRRGNWRPFEEAREYVRSLGLESVLEWVAYIKSGQKPNDIPAKPNEVYKDVGWGGWSDWLGTGNRRGRWRPFEEAREFARSLGLNSQAEWKTYVKSGQKPDDIPAHPNEVYKDVGWNSWGDWLGTGRVHTHDYRPFREAREYVRSLGLKSGTEWRAYVKSGQKPDDIPANPWVAYKDAGWINLNDWLGAGRRMGSWRPFEEAREFARSLGLKSLREWQAYAVSGQKPDDIPSHPSITYKDAGWISWGNCLGTGNKRKGSAKRPTTLRVSPSA